jgi:hypothetical protein
VSDQCQILSGANKAFRPSLEVWQIFLSFHSPNVSVTELYWKVCTFSD